MTNMITNQFLEIWNVKNCPFQYWGSETLHWLDSSNSSSVRRNINDVNRVEAGTAPVSRQKYWKLLIILNTHHACDRRLWRMDTNSSPSASWSLSSQLPTTAESSTMPGEWCQWMRLSCAHSRWDSCCIVFFINFCIFLLLLYISVCYLYYFARQYQSIANRFFLICFFQF